MMAGDLKYLARQMARYSQAIGQDVIAFENEVTLGVVAALAQATPVDTGRARSNWQVAAGSAPDGTRGAFSPYLSRWRKPYGRGGSISETQNQAGVVWSASAALKSRKDPAQAIYIVNNLPYIEPLDEGHSPQSSAGWVQRAIIQGQNAAVARFKFTNTEKVSG